MIEELFLVITVFNKCSSYFLFFFILASIGSIMNKIEVASIYHGPYHVIKGTFLRCIVFEWVFFKGHCCAGRSSKDKGVKSCLNITRWNCNQFCLLEMINIVMLYLAFLFFFMLALSDPGMRKPFWHTLNDVNMLLTTKIIYQKSSSKIIIQSGYF